MATLDALFPIVMKKHRTEAEDELLRFPYSLFANLPHIKGFGTEKKEEK